MSQQVRKFLMKTDLLLQKENETRFLLIEINILHTVCNNKVKKCAVLKAKYNKH